MTIQAKQKYTAEFKDNAVKCANESSNVAETARELGIKTGFISIAARLSLTKLPEQMNICIM
jgi:transposase-like protein